MKKLFEITVDVSYAVVIAADSEAEALEHVRLWDHAWDANADLISVSRAEVLVVREPKSDDLEDEAHEVI